MALPPTFPVDLANLIGYFFNALLHGIYIVLFVAWTHHWKRSPAALRWTILTVFILSNIDTAINLELLIEVFYFNSGKTLLFYGTNGVWQSVWREVNYVLITLIADGFMIYRIWKLWYSKWIYIIIPTLLLLLEAVFGFISSAKVSFGQTQTLLQSVTIFLTINFVCQAMIAILIYARLAKHLRETGLPEPVQRRNRGVIYAVLESSTMVAVILLIDLILFVLDVQFHWVFNYLLPQFYSLATVLIVYRTSQISSQDSQVDVDLGSRYASAPNFATASFSQHTSAHGRMGSGSQGTRKLPSDFQDNWTPSIYAQRDNWAQGIHVRQETQVFNNI